MKSFFRFVSIVLITLTSICCTEKEPTIIEVSSVTISTKAAEMIVGETLQLSATVQPSNATDKNVSWSSSDGTVVSVSPSGLVTALKEGNAVITALAGRCVSVCQISAVKGDVAVTSIELDKTTVSLKVGETITLKATVKPDDATDKTVTWTSSDKSVAKVDGDGKVTGVKEGSAVITAICENKTATCDIAVVMEETPSNKGYLSFTALEKSTVKFSGNGLEYSNDTFGWESWTSGLSITLSKGDVLYVRGDHSFEGNFRITGKVNAGGNVMSLIYKDNFEDKTVISKSYCFKGLFGNCLGLYTAPELPATVLSEGCYHSMFISCKNLAKAPDLPATALDHVCYTSMFQNCTSLKEAPELPASILSPGSCYSNMFKGCTNLIKAPKLSATTLGYNCYAGMFSGCTSLTEAPALPATTLSSGCYQDMFNGCTSLINAPILSSTTLDLACYAGMFSGCTSLTEAPALPATTLSLDCYRRMFEGCSSLTEAPVLPATTLTGNCYCEMFKNCTMLEKAPELPSNNLSSFCYQSMFSGCTSLSEAPDLLASILDTSCYEGMFSGCINLTKAPNLPATSLSNRCYYEMFSRCSSLKKAPDLPALSLESWCYTRMFYGCISLEYVKMMAQSIPSYHLPYCVEEMLQNVSATGVFIKNAAATWDNEIIIPSGWTVKTASE